MKVKAAGVDVSGRDGLQGNPWMSDNTPMRPLKEVIDALRRELDAALAPTAGRLPLTAERITLTLEVDVREVPGEGIGGGLAVGVLTDPAPGPVDAGPGAGLRPRHTLTLELRPGMAGAPVAARAVPASDGGPDPEVPDAASAAEGIVEVLGRIFGPPGGFDSFCRAETFGIAIGDLTDDEFASLPEALISGRSGPPGDRLAHACAQVGNILRSGPMQSVGKGGEALRSVLPGPGRKAVQELIARTWRNETLPVEAI